MDGRGRGRACFLGEHHTGSIPLPVRPECPRAYFPVTIELERSEAGAGKLGACMDSRAAPAERATLDRLSEFAAIRVGEFRPIRFRHQCRRDQGFLRLYSLPCLRYDLAGEELGS